MLAPELESSRNVVLALNRRATSPPLDVFYNISKLTRAFALPYSQRCSDRSVSESSVVHMKWEKGDHEKTIRWSGTSDDHKCRIRKLHPRDNIGN